MESLFEIRQYDMKNSCFKLQGGRCMDLVRVICTDFQSIREVDLEYENLKMEQFYSRYPSDIKLVCVNMPERCTEQLAFVSHKLENCQHEWKRKALKARRMDSIRGNKKNGVTNAVYWKFHMKSSSSEFSIFRIILNR